MKTNLTIVGNPDLRLEKRLRIQNKKEIKEERRLRAAAEALELARKRKAEKEQRQHASAPKVYIKKPPVTKNCERRKTKTITGRPTIKYCADCRRLVKYEGHRRWVRKNPDKSRRYSRNFQRKSKARRKGGRKK